MIKDDYIQKQCYVLWLLKISMFCMGCGILSTRMMAQKQMSRTYTAAHIEHIMLDANGVHSLKVRSMATKKIQLTVSVEGEMAKDIVIHAKENDATISIGFGISPFAKLYDDKLAAHKILSVEVTLIVPEDLFMSIITKTAQVAVAGRFEMLYVKTEDTLCHLLEYSGNAKIVTHRGNVDVFVRDMNVRAEVNSIYGTVDNSLPTTGKHTIWVQSAHGDIRLQQTQ